MTRAPRSANTRITGLTTSVTPSREGVVAFLYLIAFGSLAGFGAYAYALHYMSPTAMGTYAYVNPVVAVIFGRILLGEPISRRVIIAMNASCVIPAGAVSRPSRQTTASRQQELSASVAEAKFFNEAAAHAASVAHDDQRR